MLVQLYDVLLQYPGGLLDPHLVLADEVPDDGIAGPVQLCQEGQRESFIQTPLQ